MFYQNATACNLYSCLIPGIFTCMHQCKKTGEHFFYSQFLKIISRTTKPWNLFRAYYHGLQLVKDLLGIFIFLIRLHYQNLSLDVGAKNSGPVIANNQHDWGEEGLFEVSKVMINLRKVRLAVNNGYRIKALRNDNFLAIFKI